LESGPGRKKKKKMMMMRKSCFKMSWSWNFFLRDYRRATLGSVRGQSAAKTRDQKGRFLPWNFCATLSSSSAELADARSAAKVRIRDDLSRQKLHTSLGHSSISPIELPAMFRTARMTLGGAEAGAMRSLAHAKASPSFRGTLSARPLATPARQPASIPHLQRLSYFQTRQFSVSPSMANTRTESDAFGEVQVPSDRYWGAQTERSLENFRINQPQDRMPPPIVRAFGILKGAAATVNMNFGLGTAAWAGFRLLG
jgi:hypothetical protein